MTTAFEIPLSPNPQSFNISLGGTVYNLTVKWNTNSAAWILDIADSNNVLMVGGIPLVPGINLLEQYAYLGFTGQLIMQMDHDVTASPGYNDLGVNAHLYWIQ